MTVEGAEEVAHVVVVLGGCQGGNQVRRVADEAAIGVDDFVAVHKQATRVDFSARHALGNQGEGHRAHGQSR